ncbi:MAG: hypothetical protein ACYDDO_04590 [Acidiferrobacterales bacterium]
MELYNDNIRLTTTAEPAVTGTVTTPSVNLSARQEAWDLTGMAQWRNSRYSGQNGLDSNDQYLNLLSDYKTERSTWQLAGTYAKESALTGQTNVPDVGLVQTQTPQYTRSIAPTWTWMATETTQLQLAYQRSQVSYDNGAAVGLFNYSQDSTNLTLSNQFSERNQIFMVLGYSDFHVPVQQFPGVGTTSKTSSEQIGLTHNFSETLTGSLAGGKRKTRTSGTQCDPGVLQVFGQCYVESAFSEGSGSVYNASLQKQFQSSSVNLSFGRSIDPSGSGTQVQTDSTTLSINWQLAERLNAAFTANAYGIRALSGNTSAVDRNYYTAGPSLRWLWTTELTLDASYQYVRQKYASANALPEVSNAVYVTLTYTWPKLAISR